MPKKNSDHENSDCQTRNQIATRIKSKMDDLVKEIKERRRLEKECLDSLRDESRATVIELDELMKYTLGSNPVVEQRRLGMENRLSDIRKEVREQKVASWNDTQELKREIRSLKDVYEAVQDSVAHHRNNSTKRGIANSKLD
jgi:hypothetical protein